MSSAASDVYKRQLKELSEDLNSIQLEMKDTLSEIKNNLQETTVEWMKPRIKSMIWNTRKQQTATQNKKTKDPKNEDSINTLWDNFKRSNILIIEVPEGEEKEQEIGNLFVKIVKENFLNLVKEIDRQVQEAQRVRNKMNCKEAHSKTDHN